jgi:ubiquinone/menaquinone biosynthesis C-methylase UbiE
MLEVMQATLSFSSATTIMDVGCGPGTAVSLLIDHYGGDIPPEAQLIATDYSSGMVEAIKSRKETEISSGKDTASYWSRVETLVLDAQDLSGLSSDSVSHIMGSLVYFMLPDPKRGLREAHRVLKAGGVFACTSWAKVEWMQFLGQAVQEVRSAGGLNSVSYRCTASLIKNFLTLGKEANRNTDASNRVER